MSGSTVIVMLGQGIISPILPLYAKSFGVSLAAIGVALSAFGLARMVLNTPLGLIADRRGRRPLLVGGPLVLATGMIGSALAPSIAVLTAWRLVAGVGSAMYMTGAIIYIADIATPTNRARYIGTNQAAIQLGVAIGPAVGGFLADTFGLRAPFFFVFGTASLAGVYSFVRLGETRPEHADDGPRPRGDWRPLLRSSGFVAVSLVALGTFFTRGTAQLTLIPLEGSVEFGLSAGQIGLLLSSLAALNLVLVTPAGWVADRFGRRVSIIPSVGVTSLALVGLAVAPNLRVFVGAAALMAVGTAMAGPAPAAFAADAAPAEARGLALGMYRTAGDLGLFVGPPLLGAVADASGFGPAFAVNAALMAVAALVFWVWGRPMPAGR